MTLNSVAIAIVSAPSAADIGLSGMPRDPEHQRGPAGRQHGRDQRDQRPRERAVDREQRQRHRERGRRASASSGWPRGRWPIRRRSPAGRPARPRPPPAARRAPRARRSPPAPGRSAPAGPPATGRGSRSEISAVLAELARSRGRPERPAAGRSGTAPPSVARSAPRRVGSARRRRGSPKAPGPGRSPPRRQLGFSPREAVRSQHPLLEAGHPLERRRVGQVGRLDAHVELAGDPGRVLELVQVADRARGSAAPARGCRTTVSTCVPTAQPTTASADADRQHPAAVGRSPDARTLRRGGPGGADRAALFARHCGRRTPHAPAAPARRAAG